MVDRKLIAAAVFRTVLAGLAGAVQVAVLGIGAALSLVR